MARARVSAELRLVLACCRWPVAPDIVRAAAEPPIDWPAFRALLDRHGVVALAGNALHAACVELPREDAEPLRRTVAAEAGRSLRLGGETARLARSFAGAGIACRFLKGATLAQLAYGGLALKRSADIDVLVSPAQARAAHDLLGEAGFAPVQPGHLDPAALERYRRWGKEVTYLDARGVVVDLHVRLADNQRMLRAYGARGAAQDVAIGDVAVPTFPDPMLYAYLCYHGAAHGWSRLKWLADVNAFLTGRDTAALHGAAVEHGVGMASRVALHLCRDLLGGDADEVPELRAAGRLHAGVAFATIRHPVGDTEARLLSLIGLAMIASRATIGGGVANIAGALRALWMQPAVRARYPDERAMAFHLLRVPRFLASLPRRLRR